MPGHRRNAVDRFGDNTEVDGDEHAVGPPRCIYMGVSLGKDDVDEAEERDVRRMGRPGQPIRIVTVASSWFTVTAPHAIQKCQ